MAEHWDTVGRKGMEDTDYFMAVALLSAQRSKDPSTQVGACIVNQDNEIVGIGYNCMPNGCEDKLPWNHDAKSKLDEKYFYVCHAELNAIMNARNVDVKGCTMYVTLFPCNVCAKLIIQAGLKEVFYLSDKHSHTDGTKASKEMLKSAGIPCKPLMKVKLVIDLPCDSTAIPKDNSGATE